MLRLWVFLYVESSFRGQKRKKERKNFKLNYSKLIKSFSFRSAWLYIVPAYTKGKNHHHYHHDFSFPFYSFLLDLCFLFFKTLFRKIHDSFFSLFILPFPGFTFPSFNWEKERNLGKTYAYGLAPDKYHLKARFCTCMHLRTETNIHKSVLKRLHLLSKAQIILSFISTFIRVT